MEKMPKTMPVMNLPNFHPFVNVGILSPLSAYISSSFTSLIVPFYF